MKRHKFQKKLSRYNKNLEDYVKYLEIVDIVGNYYGDKSPYSINERQKYAPIVLEALVDSKKFIEDKDVYYVNKLDSLIEWSYENLSLLYEGDKNIFEIIFKTYDVFLNSNTVYDVNNIQIGGENNLLKLVKSYFKEVYGGLSNIEDFDIREFDLMFLSSPSTFLYCFNPQNEYSSAVSQMEKNIKTSYNPEISEKDMIDRQFKILVAAEKYSDGEHNVLNYFSKNKERPWLGEDYMIREELQERTIRDLKMM